MRKYLPFTLAYIPMRIITRSKIQSILPQKPCFLHEEIIRVNHWNFFGFYKIYHLKRFKKTHPIIISKKEFLKRRFKIAIII